MNSDVFVSFLRNISLEEIIGGEHCNGPLTSEPMVSTLDRFAHAML